MCKVQLHTPQNIASLALLKAVEQIGVRGLRTWAYADEETWSPITTDCEALTACYKEKGKRKREEKEKGKKEKARCELKPK